MSIFLDAIRSEHVLEHVLSTKKNFSTPKIYTAKGDLSKRWYVYFSFRDPVIKKLVRMKNIYGKEMNSSLALINADNKNSGEIDIQVDNFICKDRNVYYNLFNPENFEDSENSPE